MIQNYACTLRSYSDDILDLMQDGIFISDRNGLTIRVNKAYEQLTGLTQAELEGQSVTRLQQTGVFDKILNPRIVATRKPASVVQELGKSKKIVHLQGYPVFDKKGEVSLVVTFARDVTAITQLREQIAEQRRTIEQYQGRIAHILGTHHPTEGIFASPVMQELVDVLMRIAGTDATVLLLGETGAGKDVLARMVHQASPRKDKLFMKVDCGSIAENLIESELFGYVRGAFSGASSQGKAGYFEMADGGTVFLDEVGELPLAMQTKLLRVLQDHEILRVGSSRPVRVDVRIIAATNRDLSADIGRGTFRQDLYYRLNVANLYVPPLRERLEDIPLLAQYFLDMHCLKYKKQMSLSSEALQSLTAYEWPGNVRELHNMMLQLVVIKHNGVLTSDDLPTRVRESVSQREFASYAATVADANQPLPLKTIMAGIERRILEDALRTHGSVSKVARMFGINRSTLFRKLHPQRPEDAPDGPGEP